MNNLQLFVQNDLSENEKRNILLKLFAAGTDFARSSVMTGSTHNGTPTTGGKVQSNTYTQTESTSYLQFDFPEASFLNYISFHLWDYDDRVYTYTIDVLSEGEWKNVVANRQGKGIQYIRFQDMKNVKAIRMKGTNTANAYFQLLNDCLSFKYMF